MNNLKIQFISSASSFETKTKVETKIKVETKTQLLNEMNIFHQNL